MVIVVLQLSFDFDHNQNKIAQEFKVFFASCELKHKCLNGEIKTTFNYFFRKF